MKPPEPAEVLKEGEHEQLFESGACCKKPVMCSLERASQHAWMKRHLVASVDSPKISDFKVCAPASEACFYATWSNKMLSGYSFETCVVVVLRTNLPSKADAKKISQDAAVTRGDVDDCGTLNHGKAFMQTNKSLRTGRKESEKNSRPCRAFKQGP